MERITYLLDRENLRTVYYTEVLSSSGLISAPKLKKPFSVNVPCTHGELVDLSGVYYEPRQITLDCVIQADSNINLVSYFNALKTKMLSAGMKQLVVIVDSASLYPIPYQVYLDDGFEVDKRWRLSGNVAGSFRMKLIEPNPYKIVLKYTGSSLTINFNNPPVITVYWGDGTEDHYVEGTTYTHTYSASGTYYIVIVGDIDNLNILSYGGATLVWSKLL